MDIIIDGTAQWQIKAGMMGEVLNFIVLDVLLTNSIKKIDETNIRIEKVTKEVDKTDKMLKTSNAKLKDLLKKVKIYYIK